MKIKENICMYIGMDIDFENFKFLELYMFWMVYCMVFVNGWLISLILFIKKKLV